MTSLLVLALGLLSNANTCLDVSGAFSGDCQIQSCGDSFEKPFGIQLTQNKCERITIENTSIRAELEIGVPRIEGTRPQIRFLATYENDQFVLKEEYGLDLGNPSAISTGYFKKVLENGTPKLDVLYKIQDGDCKNITVTCRLNKTN